MNTYKVIEKPSGIFGITFEDFAMLMVVVLLTLFPINLLKIWIELPKWLTVVSYFIIIATYVTLRRINKKTVPGYLYSWIAYKLLTPKHLYINKKIEALSIDANTKKKKFEKDLADAIPIHTIENDKVVFKDGRVAVGFRVSSAEMESWTPGEFESFNESLRNQMGILPQGTVIQKTDIYFDREYDPETSDLEYFETRLNRHFMYRLVLEHVSFFFISFQDPHRKAKKRNPLNTLLNYVFENPFEHIEEVLGLAESKATEFVNSIDGTGGIRFHRMVENELKEVYSRYFTLDFSKDEFKGGVFCDISSTPDGIKVGAKNFWMLSLKGQGTQIFDAVRNSHGVTSAYSYMLGNYLQVPHILTTTLWVDDTEEQLKSLDRDKKLNRSLEWMTTQDNEVKAALIDEFTQGVRAHSGHIVSMSVNVAVFDEDYNLNKKFFENTKACFKAMSGAECIEESWDTLPLYMANCPGNGANNYRWLRTSDQIAVKYFNFLSNYKSELKGDMLCDRFRNPVLLNFFNAEHQNQNAVVVGPTGSGKSFSVGYFLLQRHERGARQIIIDVGGSYKNLVTVLNGNDFDQTYFEYDPDKPMGFNPFLVDRKGGKYMLKTERVNFLESLLFKIWYGDSTDQIQQVKRSVLKGIITTYYEWLEENESERPCLNSFYDYCLLLLNRSKEDLDLRDDLQFLNVREFLATLKPFYREGMYGSILNADYEKDISEYRLICFDMKRIKSDSMLYPVVSLLIIQLALDQIEKFPDDEKYLYMDEAWSMISGTFSTFMEDMYRTIRKSKGSVWMITQGVKEIVDSKIGAAILINANTKVILRHNDKNVFELVRSVIGLTDQEFEKFTSLRMEPGMREIFVKMGETSKVFAIEPPAHHAIVLSSKPDERNQLVRLIKKYLRVTDAIEHYVQEKQTLKVG